MENLVSSHFVPGTYLRCLDIYYIIHVSKIV